LSKDIRGQRFGRLVALRPTDMREGSKVVWECKCDCGNTTFASVDPLTRGRKKSCGCLCKEYTDEKVTKNLAGQRFGRLVALRPMEERKDRYMVWECQCDCGNIAYVRSNSLTCGRTASCGCLRQDLARTQQAKNLTGQRFGRLLVMKPTEERKNGYVMWECLCDCGNTVSVRTGNLTSGNTLSCGCMQKKIAKEPKFKDLTGQRFGKLVVLRPTAERKYGNVMWECQCDCGNIAMIKGSLLVSGKTKSCGCLRKSQE